MATDQDLAPAPAAAEQQSEKPAKPQPPPKPKPQVPPKPQAPPKPADALPKKENDEKAAQKAPDAAAATEESAAPKKLSGAELKAKAKAEKAARRAQVKSTKETAKGEAAVSSSPGQLGPSAGEVKGNKYKGKQDSSSATNKAAASKGSAPVSSLEPTFTIPECFSHLSMAKRIPMTQADKDVHPAMLALGQQMATFALDESIARLKATLLAFKKVRMHTIMEFSNRIKYSSWAHS